jgi:phosphoglycerate dehydrogenase-like enzyme
VSVLLIRLDPARITDEQLSEVEAAAGEMEVVVSRDMDEIEPLLDQIEIIAGFFPPERLADVPHLRWFQGWSAGVDWVLRVPEVVDMPFILTSASGVHPIPITEHVFAYLLAFGRALCGAVRAQERRRWERPERLFELAGKMLLLVGVGAIGERVACVSTAFGMRVVGVRRDPSISVTGVERMVPPSELLDVLPQADFVVLAAPLTAETKRMIGERELRAMRETAYLVNIGRGGLVDEAALVRALEAGWIAGAGLDVFETEPLPAESRLWGMGNVLITAHYGGFTPRYTERAMDIFLENLRRYRAGEPLLNMVDKRLGY